jgi:hypothetical protein
MRSKGKYAEDKNCEAEGGGGLCGLEGDFVNDVTKNNLPHRHRPQHTASKIDFLRLARRHNIEFFFEFFSAISSKWCNGIGQTASKL